MTPDVAVQKFRYKLDQKRRLWHKYIDDDGFESSYVCIPIVDATQAVWEIMLEANDENKST